MHLSLPFFFAFLAAAVTSTIAAPMPADSLQQAEARGLGDIFKNLSGGSPLSGILKRSILDELDRRGESVDELLARMDDSGLLVTRDGETPAPAPDSDSQDQNPPDPTTDLSGSKKQDGKFRKWKVPKFMSGHRWSLRGKQP